MGAGRGPGDAGVGGFGADGGRGVMNLATIDNEGVILGGSGGAGGARATSGGLGGSGGDAVYIDPYANTHPSITNWGSILGGAGGAGGGNDNATVAAASGGLGGQGMFLVSVVSAANQGRIVGGAGGSGGGNMAGAGGAGGYGAAGVLALYSYVTETGVILGGAGGDGGSAAATVAYAGGAGGRGGDGVYLTSSGFRSAAALFNFGTIEGGAGGQGGVGGIQGAAGVSGIGVVAAGGRVYNGGPSSSNALIEGSVGVSVSSTAFSSYHTTILNYGTIVGSDGVAVQFADRYEELVVESGAVFEGSILGGGGTLALAAASGVISGWQKGDLVVSGETGLTSFTNFGALQINSGSVFTILGAASIGPGGVGSLNLLGEAIVEGPFIIAGSVGGAGTLDFAGQDQQIQLGAAINVGQWVLDGGVTKVFESLTTGTTLIEKPSASIVLERGGAVNDFGRASLTGTLRGLDGTLSVFAATVGGFTIGGSARFEDKGQVSQLGDVTLGLGRGAPRLIIDPFANWDMAAGARIVSDAPAARLIEEGYLYANGNAFIGADMEIGGGGNVTSSLGVLELAGPVTGYGSLSVNPGATLQADGGLGSHLSVQLYIGGLPDVLALETPGACHALINYFTTGDTIDLLGTAATSVTLDARDRLVVMEGGVTIAKLRLSGDYSNATFQLASDGHGGADITMTTAGLAQAARLGQTMAAFGADGQGSDAVAPPGATSPIRPPLVSLGPPGA